MDSCVHNSLALSGRKSCTMASPVPLPLGLLAVMTGPFGGGMVCAMVVGFTESPLSEIPRPQKSLTLAVGVVSF